MVGNHPKNHNIAIRKDGELFRISKTMDYCPKLPEDEYCIQYGDRPCAFRFQYFDVHGNLRPEYWSLPIIR